MGAAVLKNYLMSCNMVFSLQDLGILVHLSVEFECHHCLRAEAYSPCLKLVCPWSIFIIVSLF